MFKKVFLVGSIAILTMGYTQAQANFGVRAGLNLTNMNFSGGGISFTPDMKTGFQAGIVGELGTKSFVIQPGILFAQQGFKQGGWTTTLNYIQVPVNAIYKVNLGVAKLLLQAGPYLGYGISGKAKNSDGESQKVTLGSGEGDFVKPIDFGLGVGAGVQFGVIQAGIGYNFGLANLSKVEEGDAKITNNGWAITLTCLFGK